MTDRELLELAAKAAGIELTGDDRAAWLNRSSYGWNPLHDDSDALRLFLARPWMCLETSDIGVTVRERGEKCERVCFKFTEWMDEHNGDPCAATRRAIVRTAAEIGRAMK
jgi:hypothetical protein